MASADELRRRVHGGPPDPGIVPFQWDDQSEDWPKATSWDFHRDDGTPVDTLADLENITGRPAEDLAIDLLRLPFGSAAPAKLLAEARNRRVG